MIILEQRLQVALTVLQTCISQPLTARQNALHHQISRLLPMQLPQKPLPHLHREAATARSQAASSCTAIASALASSATRTASVRIARTVSQTSSETSFSTLLKLRSTLLRQPVVRVLQLQVEVVVAKSPDAARTTASASSKPCRAPPTVHALLPAARITSLPRS